MKFNYDFWYQPRHNRFCLWWKPLADHGRRRGGHSAHLFGRMNHGQDFLDGQWIAFTARIDGNDDIYVMSSAGGTAHRVTYRPEADTMLEWSPDGARILFASGRAHYALRSSLFTIDKNGGYPEMFPMRKGFEAAFSPDGRFLAYTPTRNAYLTWKRYRGGETPPIWIVNLSDFGHVEIPHENATDTFPVWVGDRIHFLSDRDGVMSLYEYNTQSLQVRRVAENGITDIDHLGGGSGKLVYTSGGYLFLYVSRPAFQNVSS